MPFEKLNPFHNMMLPHVTVGHWNFIQ